jgi:hypothetical protein
LSIEEPDIYLHAVLLRQLVAIFRDPALKYFWPFVESLTIANMPIAVFSVIFG